MFVMDYYGHKLSNGVLFAHHLILDVPGGSSHLGYRRRVPLGHNPGTRVKWLSTLDLTPCYNLLASRIEHSRLGAIPVGVN